MGKRTSQLKPQDVVVLLKLLVGVNEEWRIADLSQELGISPSEISQALTRLRFAALIGPDKRTPRQLNVFEFLVHGLKYVFPAELSAVKRGVPTAHSAPPLVGKIAAEPQDKYVWPYADGEARGQSIVPLYPSVPEAALKDEALHELLALCDALRVGRAREQKLAVEELKKRCRGQN
jgi:hypothetical protein